MVLYYFHCLHQPVSLIKMELILKMGLRCAWMNSWVDCGPEAANRTRTHPLEDGLSTVSCPSPSASNCLFEAVYKQRGTPNKQF